MVSGIVAGIVASANKVVGIIAVVVAAIAVLFSFFKAAPEALVGFANWGIFEGLRTALIQFCRWLLGQLGAVM